ncbi:MAG: YggU family protein [Candidatus Altiarchaeales archaeon]|nr:MAG: YggU family protein [Candidatus Altiarchaeales archaeon]
MLNFIRETKDGVLIDIYVIPKSRREGFFYDKEKGVLKIRVSQPAEKGRANRRVMKLISDILNGYDVRIISGERSRRKTVLIKNIDVASIEKRLEI